MCVRAFVGVCGCVRVCVRRNNNKEFKYSISGEGGIKESLCINDSRNLPFL